MGRDEVDRDRAEVAVSGVGRRIALVCARFNDRITMRLLDGARAALRERGVAEEDLTVVWVPGAFEIPFAAKELAATGRHDAVVGLGAVIRGETGHYDFVAGECARGLQQAQLDTGVPVIFGVLTTDDLAQALARSEVGGDDRGADAALAALEMAALVQGWQQG